MGGSYLSMNSLELQDKYGSSEVYKEEEKEPHLEVILDPTFAIYMLQCI